MSRKIKILFKVPQHRHMRGVYKITFGGLSYIGSASIMSIRMMQHERTINGILAKYGDVVNLNYRGDSYCKHYYGYRKIIKYLIDNPRVTTGIVEVIKRCITVKEARIEEKKMLRMVEKSLNFYNSRFDSAITDEQYTTEWDVKKVGNEFYYYDRSEPNKLFPHHLNISATLDISRKRK